MKLKSGDIFFVMNNKNKISKLIAFVMSSKWSHSGVIYEPARLGTYTIETNDFCVTHGDFDKYLDPQYSFEVWRAKEIDGVDNALYATKSQMLNKIYPYWQLISLGIRRALLTMRIKISNFFRGGQVCCGVVINFLNRTNVNCLKEFEPQDLDTEELYQYIINSGEFELVLKKNCI